jgi:RNA polymerase sigma-70 factor (ECF subfamily)
VTAAELLRLSGVLSGLPERQREALLLSRVDGLSHLAIAARQGVSPKTVERDIIEALRRCVEGLAADDPDGA